MPQDMPKKRSPLPKASRRRRNRWRIGIFPLTNPPASARAHLIAALEEGFALTDPAQAATAQSSFDCWVEQLKEGWQISHIKQCRVAYETALDGWRGRRITVSSVAALPLTPAVNAGQANAREDFVVNRRDSACATAGLSEVNTKAEGVAPPIRVQFAHDSAALNGLGMAAIEAGVDLARAPDVTEVFIEGHADSAGTSDYNLGLSLRRAEAVWRRLIAGGVSAAKLWLGPRGETQPETPTADGARSPENRRVTILLVEVLLGEVISAELCAENRT